VNQNEAGKLLFIFYIYAPESNIVFVTV